jgi:hypothetical protein
VESLDANIHTKVTHHVQLQLPLPQKLRASQHFIYGNLHLNVHQGITHGVHRCKYLNHAAICSTMVMFSMKISHQLNITKGNSHLSFPSRNHMVEYEGMNINIMLPHHIQHQSHFPQKICIFWYFINENFHSTFIKELHREVHRHKYPYCDATPHLKCKCLNLVCEAIFWKVISHILCTTTFRPTFESVHYTVNMARSDIICIC